MWKLNSLSMVTDGTRNKADGIKCSLLEAGSQQNAEKKNLFYWYTKKSWIIEFIYTSKCVKIHWNHLVSISHPKTLSLCNKQQ